MKISIALATYNGARFIREQLDSLARQTRAPDEMVVCDDGSSDDTLEIVERFAPTAAFPVRIYRNQTNLGFNGNFGRVLSLCEGDLIFISDQDDVWFPEKIERSAAELEASGNARLIVNDEYLADENARSLGVTYLENVRKLGFPDTYHVAGCCTALRRELLPIILPFPEGINYDSWMATLTDFLGVRLVFDEPLQLYRRHGKNTTESILAQRSASTWRLFRMYGMADPRAGWTKQLRELEQFRTRISEHRELADRVAGPELVREGLERLEREARFLSRRLALLGKPRLRRLPSVLSLWRSGFYDQFAGGKSAIKDMIRA